MSGDTILPFSSLAISRKKVTAAFDGGPDIRLRPRRQPHDIDDTLNVVHGHRHMSWGVNVTDTVCGHSLIFYQKGLAARRGAKLADSLAFSALLPDPADTAAYVWVTGVP